MKKMKLFFIVLTFMVVSMVTQKSAYAAPMTYGNGYYTNLCGTGTAATATVCIRPGFTFS